MKAIYFFSEHFSQAITTLYETKLPMTVAYKVATLKDQISKEFDKLNTLRQDAIKGYYILDVDGKPETDDNGNFKISDMGKLNGELMEFSDIDIELSVTLSPDDLTDVMLSGDNVFILMQAGILVG